MSLQAICETSMGMQCGKSREAVEYTECINVLSEQLQRRQLSPWLWPDFIYDFTFYAAEYYKCLKFVHKFTTNVINERIALRRTSNEYFVSKRTSFIDILIDYLSTR